MEKIFLMEGCQNQKGYTFIFLSFSEESIEFSVNIVFMQKLSCQVYKLSHISGK